MPLAGSGLRCAGLMILPAGVMYWSEPCDTLARARAAIPDRDLQLRLIHMLMGGRGAQAAAVSRQRDRAAAPDSGDSARKQHSGSSASPPPSEQV